MSINRRHFLLAALGTLGAATTGCVAAARPPVAARPVLWPDANRSAAVTLPTTTYPTSAARPIYTSDRPAAVAIAGVVSRAAWTRHGLAGRNVNAMNGVNKITLHHEGSTPVTFTDARSTYDRLEQVRQTHTRDRGWADIGYHYVIDRAGRIIEGRDIRYQGAHVAETNEHNLGIMVLGNFEDQRPSDAQVQSLSSFVATLTRTYRLSRNSIYTHREFKPTQCPGRYLQTNIDTLRTRRAFG